MSSRQPSLFSDDAPAATFGGPGDRYRYTLRRGACHGTGYVNFILLNPSTATAWDDDPTIRRCRGFAKEWGYADLVVTNLFAWRATDPGELRRVSDPIGPENDRILLEAARSADSVVCAWGVHGGYRGRSGVVTRMLLAAGIRLQCLSQCRGGEPGHPLYLPKCLTARPYEGPTA